MTNHIRVTALFTPRQIAAIRAESTKTGAPVVEIIRRALDRYLKLKSAA